MRIYNKRNFAAGILSLALAVVCGVVLAVTGFQTKWLIALVRCWPSNLNSEKT